MAKALPKNTVPQQFSRFHPNHSLNPHSDDREYTCHICNIVDSGPRIHCQSCNVDVHTYCSDSSPELSSFLHSHPLTLLPPMDHRCCDVCRESIDGMFYRCKHCDFDVHPLCTQFPEQVRHVIDADHKLRLRKLSSGCCSVCETDCSSFWVYGCDNCGVNIHPKCLLKPYGSSTKTRGMSYGHAPPWTTPHQPNGHYVDPNGYGYGGGGHSHFPHGGPPAPWLGYPHHHVSYSPGPKYDGQPPSPSFWGSVIGGGIMGLVQNLTAGAIVEFIFGSIGG